MKTTKEILLSLAQSTIELAEYWINRGQNYNAHENVHRIITWLKQENIPVEPKLIRIYEELVRKLAR